MYLSLTRIAYFLPPCIVNLPDLRWCVPHDPSGLTTREVDHTTAGSVDMVGKVNVQRLGNGSVSGSFRAAASEYAKSFTRAAEKGRQDWACRAFWHHTDLVAVAPKRLYCSLLGRATTWFMGWQPFFSCVHVIFYYFLISYPLPLLPLGSRVWWIVQPPRWCQYWSVDAR